MRLGSDHFGLASGVLIRRELLTTLRGWRSFAVLALLVAAASGFAITNWPEGHAFGRGQRAFDVAGGVSRSIVESFTMGLLIACLVLVPAYASSAIVVERERSTFDFLSVSLVRPAGIVFAKFWNAISVFLFLIAGVAPVMGLAFFLVGVDPRDFVFGLLIVVCTAVSAGGIGLFASARFRRTFVAIAAAYIGILLLLVGPMIVGFIGAAVLNVFYRVRFAGQDLATIMNLSCPPMTLRALFDLGLSPEALTAACLLQLAIGSVCVYGTIALIGRPFAPPKIEQRRPIDDAAELERRRKQFPYYLIDPLRRKKPIEENRNAMLVREMRWGFINRGTIFVRVFYVAFVLYFVLGVVASWDARSLASMSRWLVAQIVITMFAAPALMSNALTKEYELRNMDMLRMTLLTSREILRGKLFAAAVSLLPALSAAVLSAAPVIVLGGGNWPVLIMGYTTLLICCGISLSLGLLASVLTRRTVSALVLSYVFNAIVFIGIYFAVSLFIGRDYSADPSAEDGRMALSPILAFMHSVQWYEFASLNTTPLFGYWAATMAGYAGLCLLLVFVSVQLFLRYRMQDR